MSGIRRLIMNGIALALLYGNAMVALQPPELEPLGLYIPHPTFVQDAFELTSMFTSYSTMSEDYVLFGKRTQEGLAGDRGSWIRLPLTDHFPRRHGFTTMHLYVPFPARIDGDAGRNRAWSVLARKIRANHNRLHPDRPVELIRIDALQWPADPRGFRAGRAPGKMQERMWFSEEPE